MRYEKVQQIAHQQMEGRKKGKAVSIITEEEYNQINKQREVWSIGRDSAENGCLSHIRM